MPALCALDAGQLVLVVPRRRYRLSSLGGVVGVDGEVWGDPVQRRVGA
jgi:hypothetical protein